MKLHSTINESHSHLHYIYKSIQHLNRKNNKLNLIKILNYDVINVPGWQTPQVNLHFSRSMGVWQNTV